MGRAPVLRTRWTFPLICLLLAGSNLFAGQGRSGLVVLVQDRLVYIDMGRDCGIGVGDRFTIARRTETGIEQPVSTGIVIVVNDRMSVLEDSEGGTGVSVLDVVRRTVGLTHQAPSSVLSGRAFSLCVSASEGEPLAAGGVFYRSGEAGAWTRQPLVRHGQTALEGIIPGKHVRGILLQYHFEVTTERGDQATCGSAVTPFSVPVDEGLGHARKGRRRAHRWESIVPGLYQMRSGRFSDGISLAVLEVGCLGGGLAVWPGQDRASYRTERRIVAKGLWGIGAAALLYGVADSFRDRSDQAVSDDASMSLMVIPRPYNTILGVTSTGL